MTKGRAVTTDQNRFSGRSVLTVSQARGTDNAMHNPVTDAASNAERPRICRVRHLTSTSHMPFSVPRARRMR